MSDYLANLAVRSLNLTQVIQPRLASLFEPQHPAGEPVSGQRFAWEGLDVARTSDEAEFGALASAPPLARRSVEHTVESGLPATDQRALLSSETRPRWPPTQPTPGPIQPAASNVPLLLAPPSARPAPQQPDPDQPSGQLKPGPREPASLQPSVPGGPALAPPSARPAPQKSDSGHSILSLAATGDETDAVPPRSAIRQHRQPALEPAIQSIGIEREVSPAVVAQPHITPYVEPAASAQRMETSKPAPTIRVTIGRIDVRAVMPPAPPAPRTPPTRRGPALSLDEYLKQRNRGQR